MKTITLVILLILAVIVTTVVTYFYQQPKIVQEERYVMDVEVKNDSIMGFNVDPDGFHFGSVPRGSAGWRELKITQVTEDVMVIIQKSGEIAPWVSVPSGFLVKKGENVTISFVVSIPRNAEFGRYEGEAIVRLIKA